MEERMTDVDNGVASVTQALRSDLDRLKQDVARSFQICSHDFHALGLDLLSALQSIQRKEKASTHQLQHERQLRVAAESTFSWQSSSTKSETARLNDVIATQAAQLKRLQDKLDSKVELCKKYERQLESYRSLEQRRRSPDIDARKSLTPKKRESPPGSKKRKLEEIMSSVENGKENILPDKNRRSSLNGRSTGLKRKNGNLQTGDVETSPMPDLQKKARIFESDSPVPKEGPVHAPTKSILKQQREGLPTVLRSKTVRFSSPLEYDLISSKPLTDSQVKWTEAPMRVLINTTPGTPPMSGLKSNKEKPRWRC